MLKLLQTANKRPRLDRPRMGRSWSSDVELQDNDFSENYKDNTSIADSFHYEEYESDEDMKSPDSKTVEAEKKRHTAKRKHGEICVPDPAISRDNAIVGRPDASKCSFTLQTERPDPKNPGHYIPSNPILFEYPNPVNWDDKTSVGKLNSWRYQVFKRTLGQKRESRPPWTVNEQNKLIEIVQSHLNEPSTGGRFSQINWNELERRFNAFFAGKSHLKGESTAETSYNVRGKDMVAKTRKLAVDRPHLPRSAGAIENQ